MLEAILSIMETEDESARATYDAAMDAASAAIGLDVEEDLIANLTGDILWVQFPFDVGALMEDDPEAGLAAIGVYVIGIEDCEPFLELMETAEGLVGPDTLTSSEDGDASIWSASGIPGLEVTIWIEDSRLLVGASKFVDAVVERNGAEAGRGLTSGATLEHARRTLGGGYVAAFDVAAIFELTRDVIELDQESAGFVEAATLFDVFAEHLHGDGLMEIALEPSEITVRMQTR